jgi:hypothetical protein
MKTVVIYRKADKIRTKVVTGEMGGNFKKKIRHNFEVVVIFHLIIPLPLHSAESHTSSMHPFIH